MSIPLIQKAEKDDINTSIIAIKRNIERINMLLGLVDNESPDLSGFATKQELQDAVTELQPVDEVTVDNMQSVTSNAVANSINRTWVEINESLYRTYNADTDVSNVTNRINAIKAVLGNTTVRRGIFTIRYSGGYYLLYITNAYSDSINEQTILEVNSYNGVISVFQRNSVGGVTLIRSI